MAIPAKPTFTQLSEAPTRTTPRADFPRIADAFVADLEPFRQQIVAGIDWMEVVFTEADGASSAAAQARMDALVAVEAAEGHANTAGERAALAAEHAATAEAAALAAQDAAGLPDLAGKTGFGLVVKGDEKGDPAGVEWQPVGEAIGTISARSTTTEADWLPLDGASYAQADYPDLFAIYPHWAYDLETKPALPSINDDVQDVAATPDGGRIFVAGKFSNSPRYLRVIDASDFSVVNHVFTTPEAGVISVDIDPSGRFLAMAGAVSSEPYEPGGLLVVDMEDPETFLAGTGYGYSTVVRFSPDGTKMLAITEGSSVYVFNVPDFSLLGIFDDLNCRAATWSPDSQKIAVASGASVFILDESLSVVVENSLEAYVIAGVGGLAWAPGVIYAATAINGSIFYGLSESDLSVSFTYEDFGEANRNSCYSVSVSSDQRYVCLGGGYLEIFEIPSYRRVYFESTRMGYKANRFIGDDQFLLTGDSSSPYYEVLLAKEPSEFTTPSVEPLGVGTEFKVRAQVTS